MKKIFKSFVAGTAIPVALVFLFVKLSEFLNFKIEGAGGVGVALVALILIVVLTAVFNQDDDF